MPERAFRGRVQPSSISPELVGIWRLDGRKYQIKANGFYYTVNDPVPYAINEPQLDWNGWIFERVMGTQGGLVGVWKDPSTSEELHLRADHSLTWYDPIGWQLFGNWVAHANPDTLGTSEARAFLIEKGNKLTFDVVYGGQQVYEFVVTAQTLTLTDPVTGREFVYTRVG